MTSLSDPPTDSVPEPAPSPSDIDIPPITAGLLGLLCLVFVAQLAGAKVPYGEDHEFAIPDLVAYGAMNRDLVLVCGDWWRLLTAPLLHGGFLHIAMNGIALFFAGGFIERHLGGAVLAGLLALGAVAGGLMSMALSDAGTVSVGASGGIMALIAGAALLCYTLPEAADTLSGRSLFLRILVPSLVPTSDGIDYAAHFGGALVGGGIAGALVLWPETGLRGVVERRVARGVAVAFGVGLLFGWWQLARMEPGFAWDARLMGANAGQAHLGDSEPEARALVASYPDDPNARLALSVALYLAGKPAEARAEAMQGLRQVRSSGGALFGLIPLPELQAMIALCDSALGQDRGALARVAGACIDLTPEFRAKVLVRPATKGLCEAS